MKTEINYNGPAINNNKNYINPDILSTKVSLVSETVKNFTVMFNHSNFTVNKVNIRDNGIHNGIIFHIESACYNVIVCDVICIYFKIYNLELLKKIFKIEKNKLILNIDTHLLSKNNVDISEINYFSEIIKDVDMIAIKKVNMEFNLSDKTYKELEKFTVNMFNID